LIEVIARITLKTLPLPSLRTVFRKETGSMKVLKTYILLTIGLLLVVMFQNQAGLQAQQTGLPFPDPSIPEPIDLGPLTAQSGSTPPKQSRIFDREVPGAGIAAT
jgi:hypothetical protein